MFCCPISVQFEGGLLVTAKVVYATYALSEFLGKAPAITEVCGINFIHFNTFALLSYFEKIAHMSVVLAYVSLWLCNFVSL